MINLDIKKGTIKTYMMRIDFFKQLVFYSSKDSIPTVS